MSVNRRKFIIEVDTGVDDPKACDIVFMSGLNVLVVGLDVTTKFRIQMSRVLQMAKYATEKHRDAVDDMIQALTFYMNGNRIKIIV